MAVGVACCVLTSRPGSEDVCWVCVSRKSGVVFVCFSGPWVGCPDLSSRDLRLLFQRWWMPRVSVSHDEWLNDSVEEAPIWVGGGGRGGGCGGKRGSEGGEAREEGGASAERAGGRA
eukprot:2636444-Rhodomonas_salina.2